MRGEQGRTSSQAASFNSGRELNTLAYTRFFLFLYFLFDIWPRLEIVCCVPLNTYDPFVGFESFRRMDLNLSVHWLASQASP